MMSADNWEVCPRCYKDALEKREQAREDVFALYGEVPASEWLEKLNNMKSKKAADKSDFLTFAEYYEIGLVPYDGMKPTSAYFYVRYKGRCDVCGLIKEFNHKEELYRRT